MTLSSAALTTLANVKTELGISVSTYDTQLERYIEAASVQIAKYCGRTLHYSAAEAEKVAGYGSTFLRVSRTPLLSITSITYDGSTVSSSDYSIHGTGAAGLIYSEAQWYWTTGLSAGAAPQAYAGEEERRYIVTYAGGFVTPVQVAGALTLTVPYDLEDACIRLTAARWASRGGSAQVGSPITSRTLGDASESYGFSAQALAASAASGLPPDVAAILNRYRFAVLA